MKELLREIYLATDRWLQDNWTIILYIALTIWIFSPLFTSEPVDFEAISAHLD